MYAHLDVTGRCGCWLLPLTSTHPTHLLTPMQLAGQSLSANLGCYLPFDKNPYQDLNAAPRGGAGAATFVLNAVLALLVALFCLWG